MTAALLALLWTQAALGREPVSEEHPFTVWTAGDSLLTYLEMDLSTRFRGMKQAQIVMESQHSTGLCRSTPRDWKKHVQARLKQGSPDAYLIMLGANDSVGMWRSGTSYSLGTEAWAEEYERRAGELMDLITASGAQVYWVGLPPARDASIDQHWQLLNRLYASAAVGREGVHYIPSAPLFTSEEGGYSDWLVTPGGDRYLARGEDGMHFTRQAADYLEDLVFEQMDAEFKVSRGSPVLREPCTRRQFNGEGVQETLRLDQLLRVLSPQQGERIAIVGDTTEDFLERVHLSTGSSGRLVVSTMDPNSALEMEAWMASNHLVGMEIRLGNEQDLGLARGEADAILFLEGLVCSPDAQERARVLRERLREGGRVVIAEHGADIFDPMRELMESQSFQMVTAPPVLPGGVVQVYKAQ